ncbi:MAG: hypothetical protein N4J56_003352 [Chroococcidiopsis sp. SAG 2025]|uniref:hypothetical protein n=1 Tax=Chroococcidiopsis sp. SAG 2025 TaxID=171389 RepID=UPI002936ED87|nr:hypothetical protein [Chroococcidiopsis sp. SAG 2025]MDV2993698.1 hypothetical protein [Chroococcidiopsis sp. SAG 2025]
MRYSIMLQLVTGIALILVASAALFAWLQYRPGSEQGSNSENKNKNVESWIANSLNRKSRVRSGSSSLS